MASNTALFKHVLNLMLAEDELIDEDAQYIAQDGREGDIYSFRGKPEYMHDEGVWHDEDFTSESIDINEPDLFPGFDTVMLNRSDIMLINEAVLAARDEAQPVAAKLSMRDMVINLLKEAGKLIPPEVKWIAQDENGQIFGYSYDRIEFKRDMRWTREKDDMEGTVYHLPKSGSPNSPRVLDYQSAMLNAADVEAINRYLKPDAEDKGIQGTTADILICDENDVENW